MWFEVPPQRPPPRLSRPTKEMYMDVTPRNSAAEHTNVTDAPGMLLCLLTNSFWLSTLVRSCPLKNTALIT